jgi:hypothetical protein
VTRLSKTLLAVSVTGLVAGSFIDFGGFNFYPAWDVALPFGAISYGLFLISFMLEKEVAKFDEDSTRELQMIKDICPAPRHKPATGPVIIQIPTEKFGH